MFGGYLKFNFLMSYTFENSHFPYLKISNAMERAWIGSNGPNGCNKLGWKNH